MSLQQWVNSQANPEVVVNENFSILAALAVYGRDPTTTTGLTWGYYGGRWGGFSVTAGTLTLAASETNRIVVARATGVISTSTNDANWDNSDDYARVYRVITGASTVTSFEDHRMGQGGVLAATGGGGGGGGGGDSQCIPVACSDETTPLTAGPNKVKFRMPYGFTLSAVRASLSAAQASGSIFTVDINKSGTSILSTKLTIDNTELTSTTAAAPPVISDSALGDDTEISIDIDQVGSGSAAGLKVYLIGVPA